MTSLLLACLALAPQEDPRPGLLGEYYNLGHELRDFPFIPFDKKPLLRRVDARIWTTNTTGEFWETGLFDFLYVRWTGLIRIPKDGAYAFTLASDDGSRLLIDGKEIVENGGLHGQEEKTGEVELKAGDHEIRIDYFENDDHATIKLSWTPPGGEKKPVPEGVLFHKKDGKGGKRK